MTFRMRGHEEASGVKYVPKELFEKWIEKDPIKNYERFLVEENSFNKSSRLQRSETIPGSILIKVLA